MTNMEDQLSFDTSTIAASAKRAQFLQEALEHRQIRAVIQPQTKKASPDDENAAGQTIYCCGRMLEI